MRHKLPSFGLRQFIKFTTLGLKSMASNLFKTYSSKAGIHTLNRFTYFWPPSWRMPPMSHPFWQHVLSHPRGSITQIHFKAHLFWNVKKKKCLLDLENGFSSSGSNAKSKRPEWAVSTCRVSTAGRRQGALGSVLAQTDTSVFSRRFYSLSLRFRFVYIK